MTSPATEPVTVEELRSLLDEARAAVTAIRDEELITPADPSGAGQVEWFSRWRHRAVEVWNPIGGYLGAGDVEMVFFALDQLRGLSRILTDAADWDAVAPVSAAIHERLVQDLFRVWPRIPPPGSPEAARLGAQLPALQAEYPPLATG